MKFAYDKPVVFASPTPVSIEKIKHGVTEISLSDGRLVRLTVHVEGLKPDFEKIDISYKIAVEVVAAPSVPIMDQHEVLQ